MNLTIQGSSALGLFEHLTDTADVRNLGIVDGNIVGTHNNIGLLAGTNRRIITSCYSTGSVSGGSGTIGGLIGSNYYSGSFLGVTALHR